MATMKRPDLGRGDTAKAAKQAPRHDFKSVLAGLDKSTQFGPQVGLELENAYRAGLLDHSDLRGVERLLASSDKPGPRTPVTGTVGSEATYQGANSQVPLGPYARVDKGKNGEVNAGLGLLHHEGSDGSSGDLMSVNASTSYNPYLPRGLQDAADSVGRVFPPAVLLGKNVNANAQMAKGSTGDGGRVGVDGGVFSANLAKTVTKEGASAAASASVVEGAVRLGGLDPKRDDDRQVRLGLSYGVGLGARAHWPDKDKDGHPEFGLGADVGPFSVDLKTEDPLGALAQASPVMSTGVMMARMARMLMRKLSKPGAKPTRSDPGK